MVVNDGNVAFVWEERGAAVRDSVSNITSDRDRDIDIQFPVPKEDLGSDIPRLKPPREPV